MLGCFSSGLESSCAWQLMIQRRPAAGQRAAPARQCVCAHKLSVEQLLTNSRQLFAREYVNQLGPADPRFHHHESGMFVYDFADDGGVLTNGCARRAQSPIELA